MDVHGRRMRFRRHREAPRGTLGFMSRPPLFADLAFDDAIARATADKKLLLVDFTAAWCGPCRIMDSTTWRDPKVASALAAGSIAIQVDVDAEREIAARLRVQAMPTIVALRDGVEVDRILGLHAAEKLLAWVDALARGETALDRARKASRDRPLDLAARFDVARALLRAELYDEATPHYIWIWEHMLERDKSSIGVRHSYLVQDLQRLVGAHEPARRAFAALRDEATPDDRPSPHATTLADWFSLNAALGETGASLAWFDSMAGKLAFDAQVAKLFEFTIQPLLLAQNRWADVAALYPHPLVTLENMARFGASAAKSAPAGMSDELAAQTQRSVRNTAALLVRALEAAERTEEARQVASLAKRLDASPEMSQALEAAHAGPR
jgi:thioredoxin 1